MSLIEVCFTVKGSSPTLIEVRFMVKRSSPRLTEVRFTVKRSLLRLIEVRVTVKSTSATKQANAFGTQLHFSDAREGLIHREKDLNEASGGVFHDPKPAADAMPVYHKTLSLSRLAA